MKKLDASGAVSGVLIALIVVSLLFVSTSGFAVWAFMGRQDYKNNVDQKIAVAVAASNQTQSNKDAATYAEAAKQPLKTYNGPVAYGSLVLKYPKTWSAYVQEAPPNGGTPVNGYFMPNFVPDVNGQTSFALRVQIVAQSYSSVIQNLQGEVKDGKTTATPYIPAKVPGVTGMRFDGQLDNQRTGSMVVVPIRDKTLKIWTESSLFLPDFNNNILPNYSFSQ